MRNLNLVEYLGVGARSKAQEVVRAPPLNRRLTEQIC